ncbi:MAG: VOC family protein [Betaproteobacteria bacterium]|nr:VOC family protein [Betaproteobacteria bacterium]
MEVRPYLFFEGRCEEALEFYRKAAGAQVEALLRYRDGPKPAQPGMIPAGAEDKVMHAAMKIGETVVMASDGRCTGRGAFGGFSLSINARDEKHAQALFSALGEGGQVQMPLMKTFFSPAFGMLTDRFGVPWMVIVA